MSLTNTKTLIEYAAKNNFAIAAINTNGATYDLTRAIAEAAAEEDAPVILGAYQANLQYRGFEHAADLMNAWARQVSVPMATHLDHGSDVATCGRAIDAGFTSVMIDGSKHPLDQNIAMTRQVVALAKPKGVSVEAEVGELQKLGPNGEMGKVENLADPAEVERISSESGVDMLAVGIGNAHGFYKGKPNIRTDLLKELAAASKVPLVLHGTTGLEDDVVRECISLGIAKVNLGTLIRANWVKYAAEVIAANEHQNHPWRVCQTVKDRIKEDVRRLVRLTGSAGRAKGMSL